MANASDRGGVLGASIVTGQMCSGFASPWRPASSLLVARSFARIYNAMRAALASPARGLPSLTPITLMQAQLQ